MAINPLTTGSYFDIVLRDIGLCLSAFGLAKLTEAVAMRGFRSGAGRIAA